MRGGSDFDEWSSQLERLAALPNVSIKLSGLPQGYGSDGWSSDDFEPYVLKALELFGAGRINFAGNWQVACCWPRGGGSNARGPRGEHHVHLYTPSLRWLTPPARSFPASRFVLNEFGTFENMYRTVRALLSQLATEEEIDMVLRGTATRLYGL